MKEKARKYSVRALSLALAACLGAGVVATLPKGEATAAVGPSQTSASAFEDVTGLVSTDEIRRQYLNTDLVSENVLKPEYKRWIVVDFGGDSVMDTFLAKGTEGAFSDYATTTEAHNIAAALEKKHKNFLNALSREGIEYECKYSYTALMDAVAIRIRNRDFSAVEGMAGVKTAFYAESYATPAAVDNNANAYPSGIYDSSEVASEYGVQGEGMVVAILDTGLDHTHPAFSHMPEEPAWSRESVGGLLASTEAYGRIHPSVDQVYYNSKVPFAYDYADDDPIVFPSYSNHGTHVAGIVAGEDETKPVEEGDHAQTFIGVAPQAQLMICKVFTDDPDSPRLGGADATDILAALSDCATMGADVVNMSLGTSAGFTIPSEEDNVNNVYTKLENAGISLVVAASNDYSSGTGGGYGTNLATNPDSGTVGSPSTYSAALSVASIQGAKSRYFLVGDTREDSVDNSVVITESSDGHGNPYDFMQQLYDDEEIKGSIREDGTLTLPFVVIGGVGRSQQYTTTIRRQFSSEKTIALVKRGDITFAEKVEFAKSAGAVACIIYNNVSGSIRMSLGDVEDPIPTCSITMDDGAKLLASATRNKGYITFSPEYQAGPFMSEFSSWGPTPDLKLKPEITAHGGEILSSVPGGYDTQSGTSMASPNMAGAVALLRQYVKKNNAGYEATQVRDLTNQLLMSTATMALNEVGNPYSPRKQGAGLAGIKAAMDTEGYLTVKTVKTDRGADQVPLYDKTGTTEAFNTQNAIDSDKVKVEFGDDPARTGVYDMTFTVHNRKNYAIRYTPKTYVMTETISSDLITVAEHAYMLDPEVEIWVGGVLLASGAKIEVPASATVDVRVKLSLSGSDKDYLEANFKNGMYVEGFVRLDAEKEGVDVSTVDLGIPFLAFYGDWTDAPMFDYTVYDIAASDADKSVEEADKLKAQAEATRPLGLYWDDSYVIPLGTYLYNVSEFDNELYPTEAKAAISAFDDTSARTIYELYMVSAGLLRNAKSLTVKVYDTATEAVVYDDLFENVGKSYAAGGSVRGASVLLEIKPFDWGLASNKTYRLELEGALDYEGGETKSHENKFVFEFAVDTERPTLAGYEVRYEPYTENNVTKYRIYLDVQVSDNHYVMDGMPCYLRDVKGEYEYDDEGQRVQAQQLSLLTEYPIPCYAQKGETSTLSFEITDYYDDILNGRGIFKPDDEEAADGYRSVLYFAVEDYAMNQSVFRLDITQAKQFTEDVVSLRTDEKLTADGTQTGIRPDGFTRYSYNTYKLTIAQYENYQVGVDIASDPSVGGAVYFVPKANSSLIAAKDHELFAMGSGGTEKVQVMLDVPVSQDGGSTTEFVPMVVAEIEVTVAGTPWAKPTPDSVDLGSVFDGGYRLDSLTDNALELNPGVEVTFVPTVSPWYCNLVNSYTYTVTSSSESVVVDGMKIRAEKRGSPTVRITVNESQRLFRAIEVTVNDEYNVDSYNLYNFYGDGEDGVVIVDERLNIMTMSEAAFQFNTEITKVVLPSTLTQIPEEAFRGCENLEEITIPKSCTFVGEAAFAGCKKLKKVIFAQYEDKITGELGVGAVALGRNCFRDCVLLDTIENPQRITTAYDYAFSGCTSLKTVDLTGLRVSGRSVFGSAPVSRWDEYGWGRIEASAASGVQTAITSEHTVLGEDMFLNCASLEYVGALTGSEYVLGLSRYNDGLFDGCTKLETVKFGDNEVYYFGARLFRGTKLGGITLPKGTYEVGASAFENCASLATLTIGQGTKVTAFGSSAFKGCAVFTAVALEGGSNPNHTVPGGILYSDGGATIALVPTAYAGSVTIGGTVTSIGAGAFAGRNITELNAPSVTEIGAYAFENCTSLSTVTLNSITRIAEGAFSGCSALRTVNGIEKVTYIDSYAFRNCEALAGNLDLSAAETVDAYAFSGTAITGITAPALREVGTRAFAGTALEGKLVLPALTTVDPFAFFGCTKVTGMELGPVTSMGQYAFANMTGLSSQTSTVTFAEGTEIIGAYAFAGSLPTSVSLPDTVKLIGAYAFAEPTVSARTDSGSTNPKGLRTLTVAEGTEDLTIGEAAFLNTYYLQLKQGALIGTSYIGSQAFMRNVDAAAERIRPLFAAGTPIEIGADFIGGGAFINAGLGGELVLSGDGGTYGTIVLGAEAFRENGITAVTLPAGLCNYLYEDVHQYLSVSGDIKTRHGKYVQAFGGGALGDNGSLRAIRVTGDGDFFAEDGVLYAEVPGGYELVQYPASKSNTSYTIKEGTVRIGFGAFYGVRYLTEVHIPYTVRAIGAYAFYGSTSLTDYYFEGVEAPVLEAPYTNDGIFSSGDEVYAAMYAYGMYYSNFNGYWVQYLRSNTAPAAIVLHRPENGKGFEETSWVWEGYFSLGGIASTEYAAENVTRATMSGIDGLKTPEEIRSAVSSLGTSQEKLAEVRRISLEEVQPVRLNYNRITNARQMAFLSEEQRAKLLAVEAEIRAIKAELGAPAQVTELSLSSNPRQEYYEGEKFDPAGMVVTAIYDDLSREDVTDYTVSPTGALSKDDKEITISYAGIDVTLRIVVTDAPEGTGGINGNTLAIVLGCVGGALALAAAAVVTVVVLKKKGVIGTHAKEAPAEEAEATETAETPENAESEAQDSPSEGGEGGADEE